MNIEFSPTPVPPVLKESIILNGKERGYIQTSTAGAIGISFMAVINMDVNDMFPHSLYGHGATKEKAIYNAISKGLDFADKLRGAIETLQAEMQE